MNYEFTHALTHAVYSAATKGTRKNVYGNLRAKLLIYPPYFFSLALLIAIFVFATKFFSGSNIIDKTTIKNIFPIIFIGTVIITSLSWQKIYLPHISKHLAKTVALPWKNFEQKTSFGTNGISTSIPNIHAQYEWAAIDRIIDKHGFTYFYYGQFAITLPWSTFPDVKSRQKFIAECNSNMKKAKK